jgi:hypothetical protein
MGKMSDVSDGYHTFGELYEHRAALTAALMRSHPEISWRSTKHHDGTMFDEETFIVGMELPGIGQISYHYNLNKWDWFAGIRVVDRAPMYDGHTASDTVDRLLLFAVNLG